MSPAARRRRAGGTGSDAGLTLPELLVAMVLAGVVGTLLLTGVSSGLASTRAASSAVTASADARVTVDAISRTLRDAVKPDPGSPAVVLAEPTRLAVWSARGHGLAPELVTWTLEPDGRLTEQAGAATPRVLARGAAGPAGIVFSYVDAAGAALPAGPLDVTDRARVRTVAVSVTVTAASPGAPVSTSMSTRVWLDDAGLVVS